MIQIDGIRIRELDADLDGHKYEDLNPVVYVHLLRMPLETLLT